MEFPLVDIHTHQNTCQALTLSSAGVHPWRLAGVSGEGLGAIREAIEAVGTARVEVIGEIGLDYAVSGPEGASRELQRAVFEAQLEIAQRRGLPVVLHCVRAFEPTMEILSRFELPAVIFHGFIGSLRQARRAVERGCFLSFGVRGFASSRTVEAMRDVPLDRVFLETDDDPTPIAEVYVRAAEILGIPVDELTEKLFENYKALGAPHPPKGAPTTSEGSRDHRSNLSVE